MICSKYLAIRILGVSRHPALDKLTIAMETDIITVVLVIARRSVGKVVAVVSNSDFVRLRVSYHMGESVGIFVTNWSALALIAENWADFLD